MNDTRELEAGRARTHRRPRDHVVAPTLRRREGPIDRAPTQQRAGSMTHTHTKPRTHAHRCTAATLSFRPRSDAGARSVALCLPPPSPQPWGTRGADPAPRAMSPPPRADAELGTRVGRRSRGRSRRRVRLAAVQCMPAPCLQDLVTGVSSIYKCVHAAHRGQTRDRARGVFDLPTLVRRGRLGTSTAGRRLRGISQQVTRRRMARTQCRRQWAATGGTRSAPVSRRVG